MRGPDSHDRSGRLAVGLSRQACTQVAGLDQRYPFVPLTAVGAATVTRRRPLPLGPLLEELTHHAHADSEVRLVVE